MLFGHRLEEFITTLPLDVKFDIFATCANPEHLATNNKEKMVTNFITSLLNYFDQNFKVYYNEWYNSLNIKND